MVPRADVRRRSHTSAELRSMSASPKVAPPDSPVAPARRTRTELPSVKRADRAQSKEDAMKPARSVELKTELKAISLILFGLFLAAALVAVGIATARSGFDATGTVGFIGRVLVEPLVWLFG